MDKVNNIDVDWLTKLTGDPFADTGGMVIRFLWTLPEVKDKDIMELIEYVANIYVNKWGGKLHAFFLNSKITQPSFVGDKKLKETLKYYKALIEETESNQEGYCRISGQKTKLFSAGRDNHILSGSGTFINFHHNFESGLFLSKEILIRIFFVPLGIEQLSDKVALLSSNNDVVSIFFIERNLKNNIKDLSNNISKSIQRSTFSNPNNALFDYANQAIENVKSVMFDEESQESKTYGITLNLFHFTNFGAKPTIDLHTLPATIFSFYSHCLSFYKNEWKAFISANYKKNGNYNGIIYIEESETYTEKVSEVIFIPKEKIKELEKFERLNFNLSIVGEQNINDKKHKIDIHYYVFNKNEYDYWKQSKNFKEWKAENKLFNMQSKIVKENFTLNYIKRDYSKKWANLIHNKLLKETSILIDILKWNERHSFNFQLTKLYQKNIRNMNLETLNQIEIIANYIISDTNNIKKSIRSIKTNRYGELRSFLIHQIEKNYKQGNGKLISLEDYVKYLFPEGRNWSEIRDLLLICIYQKLHEIGIIIYDANDENTEDLEELPVIE